MISLVLLILSLLHFCHASLNILKESLKLLPDTPDKYELLAGPALDYALMDQRSRRESLFTLAMSIFLKTNSIPDKELYKHLMTGLCDHLNKISLRIVVKFNSKTLSRPARADFIEKLKLVTKEEEFFAGMRLRNFEYPEKTVRIILNTLMLIDPNAEDSFDIVVYFIKYIKAEENLNLALSLVLKGKESRKFSFPVIKFHQALTPSTSFDNFLETCYKEGEAGDDSKKLNIVKTIIYGPISDYSTEIFYEIFNFNLLISLIVSTEDSKRLISRILRSNTFDTFAVFFTAELIAGKPYILEFKDYFEKQKHNYDAIQSIFKYDLEDLIELVNEGNLSHLTFMINNINCMEEYYKIDPEFIGKYVIKSNELVFKAVEESNRYTNSVYLSGCATLAIYYFSLIPSKNFTKHLNDVSYEPLLDLLLHPLIEKDMRLLNQAVFKNFVCLPHSRVEYGLLNKIVSVLEQFYSFNDCGIIFGSISVCILYERENLSGEEFINIFKWFHHIYDSRQMNFEPIATGYLYHATFVQRGKISTLMQEYAVEHKLVFKSLLKIGAIFSKKK